MFLLTGRKPRQRRDHHDHQGHHEEKRLSCYKSKPLLLLLLLLLGASGYFIVNVIIDTTDDIGNAENIDESFAIKNTAAIRTIANSSTNAIPLKKCHPYKLDMGCDLGERCKKLLLIGTTMDDNDSDSDNGNGNADDYNLNGRTKKNVENDKDIEQESWFCLPDSSMVRDIVMWRN
jgi:hypothetical protein